MKKQFSESQIAARNLGFVKESRFGELGIIISKSCPSWGLNVAKKLGLTPLEFESGLFQNGELNVRRLSDVSGMDICILSSLHAGYDTKKELGLMCSSLASASRIFGVFPFVGEGKSDHPKRFGEIVGYKNTAMQISSSGLRLITIFDQHSSQHPGFYDTTHYRLETVHHVYLMKILIEYVMKHTDEFDCVLALDAGGFKRNDKIAEILGKEVNFILKQRDPDTRKISIEKSKIIGNVKGKSVLSFDDMVQSGGTLETGAKIAKLAGAKKISFFIVHDDFSPATFDYLNPLLEDGTIDKIYILETIPLVNKEKWHKNLIVISPEDLIVNVILTIHYEGHMRKLFLEI